MAAFFKMLLQLAISVAGVYFAGKNLEKAKEAERDEEEAVIAGNRIANRADDAGELRDKFAERAKAVEQDNNPKDGS